MLGGRGGEEEEVREAWGVWRWMRSVKDGGEIRRLWRWDVLEEEEEEVSKVMLTVERQRRETA